MRLILVDVGNSAVKVNVAASDEQESYVVGPSTLRFDVESDMEAFVAAQESAAIHWLVSSVNPVTSERLRSAVSEFRQQDKFEILDRSRIGLVVDFENPKAVGLDRLVAALAAKSKLKSGESAIVVDAGTAVTVDLVDFEGRFRGGVIFPGVDAAFSQLSQRTAALPGLEFEARQEILAELGRCDVNGRSMPWRQNTAEAIVAGVYRSQLAGIDGVVQQFGREIDGQHRVFATGGGIAELQLAGRTFGLIPPWMEGNRVAMNLVFEGMIEYFRLGE